MPQAIFNPYPRNLFNYDEVKEALGQYEQLVRALTLHSAGGKMEISGVEAYAHLNRYVELSREMYSKATTVIEKIQSTLDKHLAWLREAVAQTECTQRRQKIDLATQRIAAFRTRFHKTKRSIAHGYEEFGWWAMRADSKLRGYKLYESGIVYKFGTYQNHTDSFSNLFGAIMSKCANFPGEDD